jgi:hypothetical protein
VIHCTPIRENNCNVNGVYLSILASKPPVGSM